MTTNLCMLMCANEERRTAHKRPSMMPPKPAPKRGWVIAVPGGAVIGWRAPRACTSPKGTALQRACSTGGQSPSQ